MVLEKGRLKSGALPKLQDARRKASCKQRVRMRPLEWNERNRLCPGFC